MVGVLAQIDAWDTAAGEAVSLFAASHDDPNICMSRDRVWWPTLAKLPTLRYDLFDGSFGGQITAPSSAASLRTEPWPNFSRYSFPDARVRLYAGDPAANPSNWPLCFDGRMTAQPSIDDGVADLQFAVDDGWLDTPLLPTYAGTTGAEGSAEMKGQPKPLAIGAPRYVPGTLVDSVNSVFQVSAFGIFGIEAALERLARLGPPIGDFPSYAALVTAQIPAGRWATANAVGMARLGAPPTGQMSFLIRGDSAGPNGWVRTPGKVIRRLALLAGGAGKIDEASLDALDAACPYFISINIDQQTTAREVIQNIAASLNCVAGVSWTGKLFVASVALGEPTIVLAADGSALPPVKSVQQIDIASPWQKLAINAQRTWTVHALSDIAFTAPLIDLGAYDPATSYREGNIVSLSNGSRWLYVSTTAGAGHAPAVGAYWSLLTPPLTAGDITYDDGTPIEVLKPAEPGATAGAPADSHVAGRLAQDLVNTTDVNVVGLIEQALRQDDFMTVVQAWSFVQGQPVAAAFLSFRNAQTDANAGFASASDFNSVFAKAPTGTGYTMNLQVVKAGNATLADLFAAYDNSISDLDTANDGLTNQLGTLSQNLSQTSALAGSTNSKVTALQQAFANDAGGAAKFLLAAQVDANGKTYVSGISGSAGGTVNELNFLSENFNFVRTGGGSPIKLLSYNSTLNRWEFTVDVYAKRIVAGAVDTDQIANNALSASDQWSFNYNGATVLAESISGSAYNTWYDFGPSDNRSRLHATLPTGSRVFIRVYINASRTGSSNDTFSLRVRRTGPDGVNYLGLWPILTLNSILSILSFEWPDQYITQAGAYEYAIEMQRLTGGGQFALASATLQVAKR
jgi:hypothetical protein